MKGSRKSSRGRARAVLILFFLLALRAGGAFWPPGGREGAGDENVVRCPPPWPAPALRPSVCVTTKLEPLSNADVARARVRPPLLTARARAPHPLERAWGGKKEARERERERRARRRLDVLLQYALRAEELFLSMYVTAKVKKGV